jgi:hypothetical protein
MADYLLEVAIPAVAPARTETVTSADIEVTDSGKGIILKSANGTRWRITVDNQGIPTITAL